jgi:hypothetical protein
MTWKPFELFMDPEKETEIAMPSDKHIPVAYKARTLIRNRITVRKFDLDPEHAPKDLAPERDPATA